MTAPPGRRGHPGGRGGHRPRRAGPRPCTGGGRIRGTPGVDHRGCSSSWRTTVSLRVDARFITDYSPVVSRVRPSPPPGSVVLSGGPYYLHVRLPHPLVHSRPRRRRIQSTPEVPDRVFFCEGVRRRPPTLMDLGLNSFVKSDLCREFRVQDPDYPVGERYRSDVP